jgi:hypothetical protein
MSSERREYTAGRPTTLTAAFGIGATAFTIADATNWPTSVEYDFWVTVDGGTAQEERILCSARNGTSVTVRTRGADGTTESNHAAGATVWPSWSATDADEANEHINATTNIHGITGAIAPVNNPTFTGNVVLPSTTSIGNVSSTEISYVDGVTSAIQTQLDTKAPIANPTFTGTVSGVSKSMVGLGNVDNTSDANKPISTATQTALNGKSGTSHDHAYLPTSGGNLSGPLASTAFGQFQTDQASGRGVAITQPANGSAAILQFLNNAGNAQRGTITASTSGTINITPASGVAAVTGTLNVTGNINSDNNIYSFYQMGNNWASFHESGANGYCRPIDDNDTNLGTSLNRWIRVYAVNPTISTSDERSKLDITDSPLGLDFINDLRPVSYRWKVGEKKALSDENGKLILDENGNKTYEVREGVRKYYGLISQEVKQAVDNSGVDDFAGWVQDDMSDPNSYQSLSYEQFIAPLIKSVQELSAEVQALKAQLNQS